MMKYNGKVVSVTKHQPVESSPLNYMVEAAIVSNGGHCEVKVWVKDGTLTPGDRVAICIERDGETDV